MKHGLIFKLDDTVRQNLSFIRNNVYLKPIFANNTPIVVYDSISILEDWSEDPAQDETVAIVFAVIEFTEIYLIQ